MSGDMKEIFRTTYVVTISDINYGGHLGHEKALVIFQDARIRLLKSLKYSEMDIGEGTAIVVAEVCCRYHKEIFLHEELDVSIRLKEIGGKKLILDYEVTRTSENSLLLTGHTLHFAFDYTTRKAKNLPEDFFAEHR